MNIAFKGIAYFIVAAAVGLATYEFSRLASATRPNTSQGSTANNGLDDSARGSTETTPKSLFAPWGTSPQKLDREEPSLEKKLYQFESFPFDFAVQALDGTTLRRSDYQGRVLIVDFWATWCPPCRKEIPSFVELQTKYGEAGLSIVGFNYERAETDKQALESINDFLVGQPINYPLAIGDEKLSDRVPSFRSLPTTLFIDGNGRVRMKLVGACSYANLEGYTKILLKELSAPPSAPPKVTVRRTYPFEKVQQPVGKNVIIENPFLK